MSSYPVTADASESVQLLNAEQSDVLVTSQSAEMHPLLTSNNSSSSNEDARGSSYSLSFITGETFEILERPTLSSSDSGLFADGTATFIPADRSVVYENVLLKAASPEEPDTTLTVMRTSHLTGRSDNLEREGSSSDESRMIASGVAGAVVGSLMFGPFLGAILGFGAAYSTRQEGAAGDIGRALGDVALITRDRAMEIETKHHLVQKGRDALAAGWEKAKEMDRQHHILDRVKDFVLFCWTETVDFTRRHRLLERGVQGVGMGLEWFFSRIFHTTPIDVDSEVERRTYQNERSENSASNIGDDYRVYSSSNPSVSIINAKAY